jgi:hypothetical protein
MLAKAAECRKKAEEAESMAAKVRTLEVAFGMLFIIRSLKAIGGERN